MSMSNFKHAPEDYQALISLGIPGAEVNGYQVTDGDQQALNEHFSNRLEQGFEVPEEYVPIGVSRKELEMRYQELSHFESEGKRVNKEDIDSMTSWERAGYDQDELEEDETEHDYVPEWVYNNRRDKEREENKYLENQKDWAKKKRNTELSKKIVQMLNDKQERLEEKRRENEQKSREIVEELKRKEQDNEK
jgi:hypothetical protein